MTDLKPLIEKRGLKKATIIDDAFDLVPRPDELTAEGWGLFFDDLGDDDLRLVQEIFPDYDATSREDLQTSQPFITALWTHRDKLSPAVREPLLREYETTNAGERTRLEQLKTELEALGLQCTTSGRESGADIKDVDLVFVDLFLGFYQSDTDMDSAITKAREFVSHRAGSPPLIVLMSNSTRLWEKRNEFRDQAGLLGSTFRVISKAELAKADVLKRLLVRLIDHYEDAKRVAAFVDAWDTGLDAARKRFIQALRRLDLSDFAQIRTLLLEFEGQALGEYLLDVADRVLQHEIEADAYTITAAQGLNNIDLSRYPAPHLAGSSDLQDLVNRMIFQNSERLRLSASEDQVRVEFGDLFRCRDQQTAALTDTVLLVVTPACDLIRACRDNVLVVPGTLSRLGAADWAYGSTAPKTPIFTAADGTRSWIKWDLKGRRTTSSSELLDNAKGERVARLREVQAIELQQQLLVDMGRIGQIANMPATFPVTISLYVVSEAGILRLLTLPQLTGAVCFVGRDQASKRTDHLVLTEDACDGFFAAVTDLAPDQVHQLARPSLTALKADLSFFENFERGIEVPWKLNKMTPLTGPNNIVYLYLVRNEGAMDGDAVQGNSRNAPLIMKISDASGA